MIQYKFFLSKQGLHLHFLLVLPNVISVEVRLAFELFALLEDDELLLLVEDFLCLRLHLPAAVTTLIAADAFLRRFSSDFVSSVLQHMQL